MVSQWLDRCTYVNAFDYLFTNLMNQGKLGYCGTIVLSTILVSSLEVAFSVTSPLIVLIVFIPFSHKANDTLGYQYYFVLFKVDLSSKF